MSRFCLDGRVALVTGASRGLGLAMAEALADPGRRIIMRGIRPLCHPRCRRFWLGHYRMDSSTPQSRERHLDRVEALVARL